MQPPRLACELVEHRQALMGFIWALTRDAAAAEEIFQEVALAILGEAAAGAIVDPFLPWARTVVRHRCHEHFRRAAQARRLAPLPDPLVAAVAQAFDENDEDADDIRHRRSALERCLGRLTDRVRTMLELRHHRGEAIADIARELGWSLGAVHVALSRARRSLAECIARDLRAPERSR